MFQTHRAKLQRNTIEQQKVKLKYQRGIIAQLLSSKSLDGTNEVKKYFRGGLGLVAKHGQANSISKVNKNPKTVDVHPNSLELQANGQKLEVFLKEIQTPGLERQFKHDEVQRRREAIEYGRKATKSVEEKNVMKDNNLWLFFPKIMNLKEFRFFY